MANIETTTIPGTDLKPSRVGLGTWAIGGWMWGGSDESDSRSAPFRRRSTAASP